jgi:phosphatidylserine decarboxylase
LLILGFPILAIFATIVLLCMIIFYRYYPHEKRYSDDFIVCPCDGTVTSSFTMEDGEHGFISIFLSPLDIHTQMYPANGVVVERVYDQTGKFAIVVNEGKSRDNEKKIHTIATKHGLVTLTQIAGFLPRRISSSDIVPENVKAGEYLGMIKFGSRVDIKFPVKNGGCTNICVGQRVTHGDIMYEW